MLPRGNCEDSSSRKWTSPKENMKVDIGGYLKKRPGFHKYKLQWGPSVDKLSFCTQCFQSHFLASWNYKLIGKDTLHTVGCPQQEGQHKATTEEANPEKWDSGEQKTKLQKKWWWIFLSRWGKMLYTKQEQDSNKGTFMLLIVLVVIVYCGYIYFEKAVLMY